MTVNGIDITLITFVNQQLPSGLPLDYGIIAIRVAATILYFIAICSIVNITVKTAAESSKKINDEKGKTESLLKQVLSATSLIRENSVQATNMISELNTSISTISYALKGISEQNNVNAESVINQTSMTTTIHE